MLKKIYLLIFIAGLLVSACTQTKTDIQKKENEPVIGKKELKLESDIMTPEVLWSFGRISDV